MAGDTTRTIHLTRTRLALGALALVLLCSGASYAAAQAGHPDVPANGRFQVEQMVQAGCMAGFGDGTFRPSQRVTRLGMAKTVYACAARVHRAERPQGVVTDQFQTFAAHRFFENGEQNPDGGGWVAVVASVELSTTDRPGQACAVEARLVERPVGSGPINVLEDLYLDVPVDEYRVAQRVNGTLVDGTRLTGERFFEVQLRLTPDTAPNCDRPVNADVGSVATYAPFNAFGEASFAG